MFAAVNAPLHAAWGGLDTAIAKHHAIPAPAPAPPRRPRPRPVVLDTETKLITHAIRMTAYNAQAASPKASTASTAGAPYEAYPLIREAFTGTGDIDPPTASCT